MSEKQIIDLPLNGRNYLALANLTAGVIPSTGSRDQTFSAYGNTGLQNAFLLDGGRNENYLRGLDNRARDMIRPPLDALQEFSVQTSNFSAEFGAAAGGVVNAITKSGTNTFHGSAYEFLRNDKLDARNFFAATKPLLVRNQYGGSWRCRSRERPGSSARTRDCTTAPKHAHFRDRTFSGAAGGNFGSTPILRSGHDAGKSKRDRVYSGPVSRKHNPGRSIQQLGLSLLILSVAECPGSTNQFLQNVPQLQDSKNGVVRGDTQVTSRDSMFGRYSITRGSLLAARRPTAPAQTPVQR